MKKYEELRNELAKKIIEFDKLTKKKYHLDALYIEHFKELLDKKSIVDGEIKILYQTLKTIDTPEFREAIKNNNEEIIKKYRAEGQNKVDMERTNYLKMATQVKLKMQEFKNHIENTSKMTDEEIENFEDKYAQVIMVSHPYLNLNFHPQNIQRHGILRSFYLMNATDAFNSFLKETSKIQYEQVERTDEQLESEYQKIIDQYDKLKKDFDEKEMPKLVKIQKLFDDEIEEFNHEITLRNQYQQALKSLTELKNLLKDKFSCEFDSNIIQ